MKMEIFLKLVLSSAIFSSCSMDAIKTVHPETQASSKQEIKPVPAEIKNSTLTDLELIKYAYEVGLDPKKELSSEELQTVDKRKRVRILERSLDSQKERYNYSKVLPWLKNDDEKIDYLTIPSIEGRQAWINKNKIWKRSKNSKEFQDVMESMDIAVGMASDLVKKAWGEPNGIEHSGNPIYKNERWNYIKQVSTPNGYRQEKRFVYFEGGRVVGWETE